VFAAATAGCTFEVGEDEGTGLEASVAAMLESSASAWNEGDLDAFMATYADATTTSFMTHDGPVYGIEQIRTGYAPAFVPGTPRDSLRFEGLRVRQLPPLIGLATARYVLHRGGEVTSTGWFTLVLRRVGEGWRVIHDHSSESPLPVEGDAAEIPE
ncbi:MAG: YybH family protein, partial [Gemmatimonadota bacterium]